ncbi:hypothetical protein [Paenibacillus piri]|uniref:Uncharacterized protein n=1 Tax=Paenibacillus piri TaxID=2547395 RepID=A0A4R5KSM6_9BACL|nr:hypothetical protein [Paenibacillus piri]TDF98801.1 hypothetical protein E1757_09790 [Paenibacillus piri]
MTNKSIETRAKWFIEEEIERQLTGLERGIINRDQAIGSLNTIFNIASGIEDAQYMQMICRLIGHIKSNNHYFQLKKLYLKKYFDSMQIAEEKEII